MSDESFKPLPFDGEWKKSAKKKFQETILFVPFFGAKKKNLSRHIEFVNEIGFDCVVFNLRDRWHEVPGQLISSTSEFGLKHTWADQIERLLNEIPGKKIIFSFSNPSASAIEAISRRQAADVRGLVCDGGPSGQLRQSMMNFFTHESPLPIAPLRWVAATASALLWHPKSIQSLHEDLEKIPSDFPVLSIRGWKDPLITPKMIDQVFNPHHQIAWRKLSLTDGKHLNGLKDHPDEYKPAVQDFLEGIATSAP